MIKWLASINIRMLWTSTGKKFEDWYDKNDYYRFKVGDILMLQSGASVGFGANPILIIRKCETNETTNCNSYYVTNVEVEYENGVKVVDERIYCKLNIELHFRKVGKLDRRWERIRT